MAFGGAIDGMKIFVAGIIDGELLTAVEVACLHVVADIDCGLGESLNSSDVAAAVSLCLCQGVVVLVVLGEGAAIGIGQRVGGEAAAADGGGHGHIAALVDDVQRVVVNGIDHGEGDDIRCSVAESAVGGHGLEIVGTCGIGSEYVGGGRRG